MKSLRNESDRLEILRRFNALTPELQPQWGRFTAGKMLCHLIDAFRMAHGELATKPPTRRAFTVFPLKHLFLFVIPFPKNVRTAPELLTTDPSTFEQDRQACSALIERYARTPAAGDGPSHPFFGVLTWAQWGVLQWRHTDHHLRQFGV